MLLATLRQCPRRLSFEIEDQPLPFAVEDLPEMQVAVLPDANAGRLGVSQALDAGPKRVVSPGELRDGSGPTAPGRTGGGGPGSGGSGVIGSVGGASMAVMIRGDAARHHRGTPRRRP